MFELVEDGGSESWLLHTSTWLQHYTARKDHHTYKLSHLLVQCHYHVCESMSAVQAIIIIMDNYGYRPLLLKLLGEGIEWICTKVSC